MRFDMMRAWFVVSLTEDFQLHYLAGPYQDEDGAVASLEAMKEQMDEALAEDSGLPADLRPMFAEHGQVLRSARVVQLEVGVKLVDTKLVVTP